MAVSFYRHTVISFLFKGNMFIKYFKSIVLFCIFLLMYTFVFESFSQSRVLDHKSLGLEIPDKFVHPGIIHTSWDIKLMQKCVSEKKHPGYECYLKLSSDKYSQYNYRVRGPFTVISRRDKGRPYEEDFNAAFQNSIMYVVTGEKAHAEKASEILKLYASTLKLIDYADKTRPLLAGIMGLKFVYAAEMMRYTYPQGMSDNEFKKVCEMFKKVFVPVLEEFYITKPYTNGNWGASVNMAYITIAVLLDDMKMYKKALDFYVGGNDNGNILNYIDGETGQCQETGRDQQHVQLGLECLAKTCEIAYKQGTDLYGVYNNRLAIGYEYTSQYNLGYDVPYKVWKDITGKYCRWSEVSAVTKKENNGVDTRRGVFRPIYEMVYNHYVNRKGLDMPFTKKVIDRIRPEGWFYEHFGFGTFLFNEDLQ